MMTIRGLAVLAVLSLLAACTAGSGRSDAPTTEGAITNIVVGGSGPTGSVTGGDTVNFVMTVTNNGPSTATNFNVFDNVGSGLTVSTITCSASGGATCPGTVGVLTAIQSLPAGGTLTFKVAALVGQLVSGTVSNQLSVDVTTNPNHAADSFVATATVVTADLSVTATPPVGPLPGGTNGSFTATVTNNGPAVSQNVTVTNTLSSGLLAAGAITCTASAGALCPSTLGASMTVSSIPINGVLTFTIPTTVKPGTTGAVTDTITAAADTDPRSGNNTATASVAAQSPDLSVSVTGTAQVGAGTDAVFTAVISNVSSSNATNATVSYSVTGSGVTGATVACTPSAGAACPLTFGPVMTVPTLNAGRSLTFKFTVSVPSQAAGGAPIVLSVAAAIPGDPNLANNQASFSSAPINPNSGPYEAYAANGQKYLMTFDFDNGTYTVTGTGVNLQRTFIVNTVDGGYLVNNTVRFRTAPNLIVGGEDFDGGGVVPYMAGRVFGTALQQLGGVFGGVYDLVTLNIPSGGGPPVTRAGTAKVSGNLMLICQSDTAVYQPQACPSGSLHTYALTISNNVYTGTDTTTHQTFPFQLAIIGATVSIVSAGTAPDGSQQLRIGLPDSLFSSRITQGASTTHDWITMTVTANSYSFISVLGDSDQAVLTPIVHGQAPFSMLVGNRASDSAKIYVMQSYPLTIAFGSFGDLASGLLQVTVP